MTDRAGRRQAAQSEPAAVDARVFRVFIDADGLRWRVHEQPFAEYDRRRGRSLIFSSEAAVRRVRDYPENWFSLSDEELAALSWKS